MKNILLSILAFMTLNVTASTTPVQDQEKPQLNLLLNGGFENGKYNWTASGGATATVNATAKGFGAFGYDWDSNSASQTLISTAVTIPAGLYGRNGVAYCGIKTVSGTATHTLTVDDGTTNIVTASTISQSTTKFDRSIVFFSFPTSGNIRLKLNSVASNEPEIYIDDCFIGDATPFIHSGAIVTDWVSYTPTGTWTANTTYTGKWRRVGDSMEMIINLAISGTPTSADLKVSYLPSGYSIDTAKSGTARTSLGTVSLLQSGVRFWIGESVYDSSTQVIVTHTESGNTGVVNQANPWTFTNNDNVNIMMKVPIVGWYATGTYAVGQLPSNPTIQKFTSGSGTYITPNGVSYIRVRMVGGGGGGDGTAGGGGGGTGTASTFGSSLLTASAGTRITGGGFTINSPAVGTGINGSAGGPPDEAVDGAGGLSGVSFLGGGGASSNKRGAGGAGATNSGSGGGGAGGSSSASGGFGGGAGGYIEAIITSPSSTYSYTVGTGGAAGTAGGGAGASIGGGGAAGIIEVTEYYSTNSPVLIGSVTSNSTGAERIERASITLDASFSLGADVTQSGSWIASGTRNASGDYTMTFTSGIFSSTPVCTITAVRGLANTRYSVSAWITAISSSAVTFSWGYNDDQQGTIAAAIANVDDSATANMICMGSR